MTDLWVVCVFKSKFSKCVLSVGMYYVGIQGALFGHSIGWIVAVSRCWGRHFKV